MYRAAGRSTATAATANVSVLGIWNPHATLRARLVELHLCAQGAAPTAGASLQLRRISARGTATSTVTPIIENDIQRAQAPTSGLLLDLAYSAQPTLVTSPALWQWSLAAVVSSGVIVPIELTIPPGTGLTLATVGATVHPATDVSIAWKEEY